MKTLAEHLGVIDPRPEDKRPETDFDVLVDVNDPKEFCRRIVGTREWRQYVMNGIVLGDLPSAVMTRILDHAWGKPVDRVEVKDTTDVSTADAEALERRALFLAEAARAIRARESDTDDSVH